MSRSTLVLDKMESLEKQGKTAMLAAVDGNYAGIVAVADTIKEHLPRDQANERNGPSSYYDYG